VYKRAFRGLSVDAVLHFRASGLFEVGMLSGETATRLRQLAIDGG
jgi:hypothetical protein